MPWADRKAVRGIAFPTICQSFHPSPMRLIRWRPPVLQPSFSLRQPPHRGRRARATADVAACHNKADRPTFSIGDGMNRGERAALGSVDPPVSPVVQRSALGSVPPAVTGWRTVAAAGPRICGQGPDQESCRAGGRRPASPVRRGCIAPSALRGDAHLGPPFRAAPRQILRQGAVGEQAIQLG